MNRTKKAAVSPRTRRQRREGRGQSFKQRTNGHNRVDARSTIATPLTMDLGRMLRPQAAFRWILPNLAAITPLYIEMTLRGALAGNHVQQWELFDLMLDTWPELTACVQELTYGLMRKRLIFEAFHEEDEKPTESALERSRVVSSALRRMRPDVDRDENALDGTLSDIADGWFRGITVLEVLWQTLEDPKLGTFIGPKATFWVHPICFAFNQEGVLGLRSLGNYSGTQGLWPYPQSTLSAQPQPAVLETFPEHKFLIGIHKSKSGTALAGPLFRPLAWWWVAANFSADWCLNLAQVFGLPFRWANYDPSAPQATVDAICSMLQNMGSNGWAAFPAGTTLELKEGGRSGTDKSPQGELLDRADRYVRTLILGQTMTGGVGTTGKGGGQAFGVIEKDVKDDRIEACGRYITGVVNGQLIPSILQLNYGDESEAPEARFLSEEEDLLATAQRDQVLISMGLPIGVNYLRKKYDIPEPEPGEVTLSGPQQGAGGGEKLPGPPEPKMDSNPDSLGTIESRSVGAAVSAANVKRSTLSPTRRLYEPEGNAQRSNENADLERYLGPHKEKFLKAFANDLQPLRSAIEIALAGQDETAQRSQLLDLHARLPEIYRHIDARGTAAPVLAEIIAEAFSEGWNLETRKP